MYVAFNLQYAPTPRVRNRSPHPQNSATATAEFQPPRKHEHVQRTTWQPPMKRDKNSAFLLVHIRGSQGVKDLLLLLLRRRDGAYSNCLCVTLTIVMCTYMRYPEYANKEEFTELPHSEPSSPASAFATTSHHPHSPNSPLSPTASLELTNHAQN